MALVIGGSSLSGISSLPDMVYTGRLISIQTFSPKVDPGSPNEISSASGSYTWTKPSGCRNVLVYVTGGGGGSRNNDNSYRGAGGGGGGTAIKWIDVTAVSTVAVTVGAGGAYARGSGRGATGGTSSFGSYCSATGGVGGQSDDPYEGGIGGFAIGGDINIPGGAGEMSHDANREGGSGSSFWHKAGSNHSASSSNGSTPWHMHGQWGSGGSGASYYSQNYYTYMSGGSGVVIVYNYS